MSTDSPLWKRQKKTGGRAGLQIFFSLQERGLFSNGLVVAALGGVDLACLLQFGAGLGNLFGIHTEGLGDVARTDGLASFFHSVEDLNFHGELLMCGLGWRWGRGPALTSAVEIDVHKSAPVGKSY